MRLLYGDTETFSECDLTKCGSARYAEDESTEITIAQWALDDDEPTVWDCTAKGRPQAFIDLLLAPDTLLVFHNSSFDRLVIREVWGVDLPPEKFIDTMVKALSHGLPGSLDKIGQIVGLDVDLAKDKRGRELIQLFAKPRPKNSTLRRATRETHPKEWQEFLSYSRQDIVAMRAIDRRLPSWNYRPGHPELALWHLDQKINTRGIAVDLRLAESAIAAVALEQKRLKEQVTEATGGVVTNASQRDNLLTYICAEYGVSLPDLKADTLRRRIEDPELPDAVKLLLSIRLEATKTSTAKYKALTNAITRTGRLCNSMQFAGASRTARWAHRLFQPGNMPRPDMKQEDIDEGIEALKANCADLFFKDVMRLTSNTVRGCIVAPPGKKMVISDLSNIEGRGLAFLAGERWKLKAFSEFDHGIGADLYKRAYAAAFGISPEQVTKSMRQIGKVMELALGYEGGVAAFLTFAVVYGMDLEELAEAVWAAASPEAIAQAQAMHAWFTKHRRSTLGLPVRVWIACEVLVLGWREAHPNTKALWKAAGESVRAAIANPGESFAIGEHLKARRDGAWLRIRLPSGRYLCYINPKVEADGQITYFGVNQYTRQWGPIKTYGGKLVENCTQAFARDILAYNMPGIEAKGYEIVLSVHDELLTETPDTDDYNVDTLSAMMSTAPLWAHGIPLAAAGFETTRYRKD